MAAMSVLELIKKAQASGNGDYLDMAVEQLEKEKNGGAHSPTDDITTDTEIVVVMDRSGSMHSIRGDMEGGYNKFISDQRALPGLCKVSLYQFDDRTHEANEGFPMEVYAGKDVRDVPKCVLEPRSMTALNDAVGLTIVKTAERLQTIQTPRGQTLVQRADLPKIIFIVITDGLENSSKEYTKAQVKELQDRYTKEGWEFVFIGANVDAFEEGMSYGTPLSNNLQFSGDSVATAAVYSTVSHATSRVRSGQQTKSGGFFEEDEQDVSSKT